MHDLDGDGLGDVAVGSHARADRLTNRSRVELYSSASGALLHVLREPSPKRQFGASVRRLPDVDGDGIEDYAVGAPGRKPFRLPEVRTSSVETWGAVYVFSGTDHRVMRRIHDPRPSRANSPSRSGTPSEHGSPCPLRT